jgi:hypothetical protein
MLYLVAFFCPPVALLLCGKPLSALLNLLWILSGFLIIFVMTLLGLMFIPLFAAGATVHALLVVNQHHAEERQRELIGALGGYAKPKKNWEWDALAMSVMVAGAIVFILLTTGAVAWRFDLASRKFVKTKSEAVQSSRAEQAALAPRAAAPSIDGWSFTEVKSTYGDAVTTDKASGWAMWPKFRARFEGGIVQEVEGL